MISRRSVQTLLGIIWFLDGVLQLKPQMFTTAFLKQVVLPTGEGEPHWIAALVNWGASVTSGHIAIWNVAFALVQIVIGVALVFNFKTKLTLSTSLLWSFIVWVFGEGLGQLFTGQSLLMTGAPGAVALYGLIGIAIWPDTGRSSSEWSPRGVRFAQLSIAVLFLLGGVLQFQSAYLTPSALSQAVAVQWLAKLIGHNGAIVSVVLAAMELVIAALFAFKVRLRASVWVVIAISFVFWWVGQSFGQVFDPLATDFNSGLLMIVLAISAYPHLFDSVPESNTMEPLQQAQLSK